MLALTKTNKASEIQRIFWEYWPALIFSVTPSERFW
jgi:hypothetical protein